MLEGGQGVGAHAVEGHVDLDAAGGVLQGGKAGLAHDALEHHAACHAGGGVLRFQLRGFDRVELRVQRGSAVGRLEIVRESHALGTNARQFFATLGHQFVGVHHGLGSG